MKTLQTFTLREIAFLEGEQYQNILNAKKRGEYLEIAIRSGIGKNAKISHRYLSRRMSEVLSTLMSDGFFDTIIENDVNSSQKAMERKRTQKLSSHSSQYGTLSK